jgi:hypothetical protein
MIMGTIFSTALFLEASPSLSVITYSSNDEFFMIAIALTLYALCYSLTALTIKRIFFAHRQKPNIPAVIALLLLVTGSVIPMVIGFLLRPEPWHKLSPFWLLGNPFVVFWEKDMLPECLSFTSIWAVGVFAVTIPWLIKQIRAFKPAVFTRADVLEARNE